MYAFLLTALKHTHSHIFFSSTRLDMQLTKGKGKPLHMCVTYRHMLYTHFYKSPYEGTHARQITHIASQETPLLLTPLFFPPCLSLLLSVLLHTPPYTRISYIPEMTSSDIWPLPHSHRVERR